MKTIREVLDENPGCTEFVDAKGNVWCRSKDRILNTDLVWSHENCWDLFAIPGLRPLRKKRVEIEGVVHGEYLRCENIVFKTNEKPHNKHIAAKLTYEVPDYEPEPKKAEGREMWLIKDNSAFGFKVLHSKPTHSYAEVIHVREVVE